ncbi:hypothetical protein V6N13_019725 [Hibiscus sabdariffa]
MVFPMRIQLPSHHQHTNSSTKTPKAKHQKSTCNLQLLTIAYNSSEVKASKTPETKVIPQKKSGHRMGAGVVATIVFGLAFVVVLVMCVF